MLNKHLQATPQSKLEKVVSQISEGSTIEKTGFIKKNKTSTSFKSKTFRLREPDFINLSNIILRINREEQRVEYSDSQVIRGLINYFADNMETQFKKILPYIKSSS
jgi:flagellar basal body P-ring protein FlgI